MRQFHVLFVESYDSFSYNVVRLIEQQKVPGFDSVHVTTIHNDTFQEVDKLLNYLEAFECVVVGPGPGNPANGVKDVGIINSLFTSEHAEFSKIPMLGICLGFQAMCFAQGCVLQELDSIKHGQVYEMVLNEVGEKSALFEGYPSSFKSVRYHSLVVTNSGPTLEPLAYTEDENGKVLMAAYVDGKPWYGVQYHPESCCSEFGSLIVSNFLRMANGFNKLHKKYPTTDYSSMLAALTKVIDRTCIYERKDTSTVSPNKVRLQEYSVTKDPKLTLKICDLIKESKFVLASSTVNANRGEWSIIALPNQDSVVFTYYDQLQKTVIHKWRDPNFPASALIDGLKNNGNEHIKPQDKSKFWATLGEFMKDKLVDDCPQLPFIGGLVGILGYEMGSYVSNKAGSTFELQPDAKLVYIENSILLDHNTGKLYFVSLAPEGFPKEIQKVIMGYMDQNQVEVFLDWSESLPSNVSFNITKPEKSQYKKAFNECQKTMRRGDSYEMCLTTQTRIVPSVKIEPWRIFQTLVQCNPAPFSSFLQFDDIIGDNNKLCLISTSPERFLKWNAGTCELRPIKGTVKKTAGMTLEKATTILKTPKEFGENLMILDLIRNDLFELVPDVRVEEFMSVEEYKTVYQLVSVVKAYGLTAFPNSADHKYSGLDILKHTLPPGSMTGAPKKITVELLQDSIEKELNKTVAPHGGEGNRGIYSGVTGYWSANGRGDWSVNIRCMYSYNGGGLWHIGAGGAITVLSTLEGEMDEMHIKLESALQVFQ